MHVRHRHPGGRHVICFVICDLARRNGKGGNSFHDLGTVGVGDGKTPKVNTSGRGGLECRSGAWIGPFSPPRTRVRTQPGSGGFPRDDGGVGCVLIQVAAWSLCLVPISCYHALIVVDKEVVVLSAPRAQATHDDNSFHRFTRSHMDFSWRLSSYLGME